VAELTGTGIEANSWVCDTTDETQLAALADFAWDAYGHVDVIVANAGIMGKQVGPVLEGDLDNARAVLDTNFFGMWATAAVFGRRLVEQGTPAAIYIMGSENSFFHGIPAGTAYVASKHAALALAEGLREEAPDFIDVGLIAPGFVHSEMVPFEQAMDTERWSRIAMEQIEAGSFYIVSHAYNMARIGPRYDEVAAAYARYAPRYEGDIEFDVRTLMQELVEQQAREQAEEAETAATPA
jgi:NAD(P)-dependent dehydrogenase (short-subunit alcohol dehydrogenase family)